MKTTFQKTMLAIAISALFGSAAIAADNYSTTIDGATNGSDNQNMQRSTDGSNTHEQEFNETIDASPSSAGDKAKKDGDKHDKSDKSSDRPMTEHQTEVLEEEEEEEEVGRTETDKNQLDTQKMDETPYGATGAGTPVSKGGLYAMSADDLIGMDVVTSDGKDVGDVKKIVISPDNQNIHAVVSIGGILGLGASTILIPLDQFTHKNDELHVKATKSQLEAMTDYGSENFVELEGDAALSTALRPRNN